MSATLLQLFPFACLSLGGLGLLVADSLKRKTDDLGKLTAVAFLTAMVLAGVIWWRDIPGVLEPTVRQYLAVDRFALFFDVVVAFSCMCTALMASAYLKEHGIERGEFYPVLLFSGMGAMFLGHVNNLLSLFISLEIMSLGVYAMVAYRRGSLRATEAGVKYFLLGSFATAVLLFGCALIYGATGHTAFRLIGQSLSAHSADPQLMVLGTWLLVCGFAFKISAAPFHMWTPDVYEGAPTPVTALMSVVVKAGVVAVMLRVFGQALGEPSLASTRAGWTAALGILAALTMIIGNFAALVQSNIKRMLAYSSIAHVGYLLLGIAAGQRLGQDTQQTVLYYVASYSVSSLLAFGALIALGSRGREAVSYQDVAGAGRRHPVLGFLFSVGILSLMGFPPTAGFFGKYLVLANAIQLGGSFLWLSVLGIVTSIIGAYYYLKVIVYLYMRDPENEAETALPMKSWLVMVTLVVLGYFVLKMGVTPARYLEWAAQAAGDV